MIADPPRQLGFDALWQAIRARPKSLAFGIMFIVIPIFQYVFFSMLFLPHFEGQDSERIRAACKPAPGKVILVEPGRNLTFNGVQPERVVFRYKADGVEHEASMETVSVTEVSNWQPGRAIEVRHLDGRATIIGLEPVRFPFPTALMAIAPLLTFDVVGIPFLVYAVTGVRRKYGLLKHGVVLSAKLLSCETLSTIFMSWQPTARFKVVYVYADSTGRELTGSSPSTDLTLLNGKKKGDEVQILVLPADERQSMILDSPTERTLDRR
jgi:hypothetical protein